ncbi:SDR family oxidoreductase [Streptomyces sp. WMMC500]|uniref:SDR family NAD(P)-dependent oxidoreductase n=1 Tax=Streptomyces sp. WMMC500 TaxID=3015154 RepID=UPI00248B0ABD|nr:SDR family NAD(P)-dependent oxidoreductase [Streptomyces sp. WMMC500]WBB61088.1 SDR family oxidoreductase [Streptomyces sp. WMMC500]
MAGAVVVGAGPGIGAAVARRFAREGLPVTLVARSEPSLTGVAAGVAAAGGAAPPGYGVLPLAADVTDEAGLRTALDTATARFGVPDAVVYNAALVRADRLGELAQPALLDAWAVNVGGALTAATHLAPAMARRGGGSFLITGGMPEPKAPYVSLSLGKAGVRTLARLLALEYGPQGVHVATVTVDGAVAPGTDFDPDVIAEHYWRLHTQPRSRWEHDVRHAGAKAAPPPG